MTLARNTIKMGRGYNNMSGNVMQVLGVCGN